MFWIFAIYVIIAFVISLFLYNNFYVKRVYERPLIFRTELGREEILSRLEKSASYNPEVKLATEPDERITIRFGDLCDSLFDIRFDQDGIQTVLALHARGEEKRDKPLLREVEQINKLLTKLLEANAG